MVDDLGVVVSALQEKVPLQDWLHATERLHIAYPLPFFSPAWLFL